MMAYKPMPFLKTQGIRGQGRGLMTHRTGSLGAGIKPGPPAARTTASTHGTGVLPTELDTTPKPMHLILF